MAQDPQDAETIKAHLLKYGDNLECPICKTNRWEVGGPIGYSVTDQVFPRPGDLFQPPGIFPLAFMLCATCGYVRHFGWKRITETQKATEITPETTAESAAETVKKDG